MPLSDYERRVLEQMERQLSSDDPKLAQTFSEVPRARRATRVVLGSLIGVGGLALLVCGLAFQMSWLGIVGFLVMFAGVLLALTRGGGTAQDAAPAQGAPGAKTPHGDARRSTFMDRLDDRWDKRREDR